MSCNIKQREEVSIGKIVITCVFPEASGKQQWEKHVTQSQSKNMGSMEIHTTNSASHNIPSKIIVLK